MRLPDPMHINRRRNPHERFSSAHHPAAAPVLVIPVLLATCATASIASATTSSQAGLGRGLVRQLSGSYRGTFTIHWTQGRSGALKGSIALSSPHGTYPINGKVSRNVI